MEPSNVLSITTLSEGWCDKDTVMLHACFQLLSDCVEKENLLNGHIDWGHDSKQKAAKTKIQELYDWWQQRKNSNPGTTDDLEPSTYNEDTEMLTELIKVRQYLWT